MKEINQTNFIHFLNPPPLSHIFSFLIKTTKQKIMKTLKLLILSGFLVLFSNTSFSQGTCIDSSIINLGAFCPTVIDPVCGCDGVTYNNACEALNWHGVTSWTPGPCSSGGCQAGFGYTFGSSGSLCDISFYGYGASSYSWDFGDGNTGSGQNITHTYATDGSYYVLLMAYNANGVFCDSVNQYITVTGCGSPCTLNLYDSIISPYCYNSCDGFAEIFVSGGSPPYTFAWSNGITTSYGTNLCCGIYTVSVIDSQGCTGTITIDMDCPAYLELTATTTNETAPGANNGTITALASGGTPSYMYSIDNGITYQASNIFTGLAAGVYIVSVMDNHGCISIYTVIVESGNSGCQAGFTYTFGSSGSLCDISFYGYGANSYSWDFGDGNTGSGQNITHTYAVDGNYYVLLYAYNANGVFCDSVNQYITVTGCGSPCTLNLYDSIIPPSCYNSCDGFAEIFVSGGSPPYTFVWSNGITTSYGTNLCCGIYTISVTDSQGCTGTIIIDMDCPAYLELTATSTNESSPGANDGTITALASGGTPGYMYSIDNGSTYQASNVFTGLAAGIYVVYVMDVHGCISIYTIMVDSGNLCEADFYPYVDSSCTVYFTNTSQGASSFEWIFGDGNTSTQMNPSHTYPDMGPYVVVLIAYDIQGFPCDSTYQTIVLMDCTSGLNENIADFGLEIYPNPTAHGGKVDLTLPMSMNVDIKILSIMGKTTDVIYSGHLDSGEQSIPWTSYDLASGIYIIQISTPYGVQKKKLLIQR